MEAIGRWMQWQLKKFYQRRKSDIWLEKYKYFSKGFSNTIVAFANADGGDIAIGITDKTRRIEDIDFETKKLNELLRVPFDFCNRLLKLE